MKGDERICFGTERSGILEAQLVLKLGLLSLSVIPLFTRHLTCSASDALRIVYESRLYRN